MDELEIARMIVRLGGDASEYEKMIDEATELSQEWITNTEAQLGQLRQALESNTPIWGKTIQEMEIYEQTMSSNLAAEQDRLAGLQQQAEALDRLTSLYRSAQSVTESVKTPTEVYTDRLNQLKQMLDAGFISQQTFNRAVQQTKDSLDRTVSSTRAYQQALGQAQGATRSFASNTASILASVGLSFGILSTAMKGVRQAAGAESTRVDLEVLLGSAEAAKKMIADLVSFSDRTPLRLPGLLSNTKQLLQMGVASEQIVPILQALGNASGGVQSKLDQLTYVFGRIASTGRVTMHEIRMLTTAGFNPLKEINKQTGESIASLTEKLHKGGITAQMVVEALNNASKAGGTFAGRLEKQSQTLGGLFSTMQDHVSKVITQIGNILIEGLNLKGVVRNVTEGSQLIVAWLKSLTPETTATISQWLTIAAALGAAAFAFTFLSPVIGTVVSVLGTLLGVITTTVGAIAFFAVTPIGLLIGALAALAIATGHTGDVVGWFGQMWASVVDYLGPAIKGIKDAISARDLQLAFQIAWAQIKLTYNQVLLSLVEGWINFTFTVQSAWAGATAFVRESWEGVSNWVQGKWIEFKQFMGMLDASEAMGERNILASEHKQTLDTINRQKNEAINEALSGAQSGIGEVRKELEGLTKERDDLIKKAGDEAKNAPPLKLPTVPQIDPNAFKPPAQKMHVTPVMHWEAALVDSAEAAAQVQSYFSMMGGEQGAGIGVQHAGGGRGMGGGGVGGGGEGITASPMDIGSIGNIQPVQVAAAPGLSEDPTRQKMVDLLGKAVEYLAAIAGKRPVDLTPANLG